MPGPPPTATIPPTPTPSAEDAKPFCSGAESAACRPACFSKPTAQSRRVLLKRGSMELSILGDNANIENGMDCGPMLPKGGTNIEVGAMSLPPGAEGDIAIGVGGKVGKTAPSCLVDSNDVLLPASMDNDNSRRREALADAVANAKAKKGAEDQIAERRRRIQDRLAANKKSMDDLSAVVDAMKYGVENGASVDDLSAVFTGMEGSGTATALGLKRPGPYYEETGCTGFDPAVCDKSFNQMFHIWFYVQLAFHSGSYYFPNAVNHFHEVDEWAAGKFPDGNGKSGSSVEDDRAGTMGAALGYALSSGKVTMEQLPERFRFLFEPPSESELLQESLR